MLPVFDMAGRNRGVPVRGQLTELYRLIDDDHEVWAFRRDNTADTWLDPALMEAACTADPKLMQVVTAELARVTAVARTQRRSSAKYRQVCTQAIHRISQALEPVFDTVVADAYCRLAEIQALLAEYLLAKAAYQSERVPLVTGDH